MPVTLKFQSTGTVPNDGRPVKMLGSSITIGRGAENDLVLPDTDRLISKSHCVIEENNGDVFVIDLSTNGTYLNYGKTPLGRVTTPLNDGDVLTMGTYELVVEIDLPQLSTADILAPPVPEAGVSPGNAMNSPDARSLLDDPGAEGDFLDDLLGSEGPPRGPSQIDTRDPIDDLLPPTGEDDPFFAKPKDPHAGMGASIPMHNPATHDSFRPSAGGSAYIPEDWDEDDLLAPQEGPAPSIPPGANPDFDKIPDPVPEPLPDATQTPDPTPAPQPAPEAQPAPAQAPAPKPEPAAPPTEAEQAAALEFIKALDVEDLTVPEDEMSATFGRLGRVLRAMIVGIREVLMTRTSIKDGFGIEQTRIGLGGNNPLKFSISEEQAIEALVRSRTKGYLDAEQAVEEALQDIKAHEVAMIAGMDAALKGVLTKLDPQVLAAQIETKGGLGGLLKGKKARYWEVYEKLYSEISDQAEDDFHDLFRREFARAYKAQLDKLKS